MDRDHKIRVITRKLKGPKRDAEIMKLLKDPNYMARQLAISFHMIRKGKVPPCC
jgi:ribosomal protein S28E/S33